MKRILPFLFFVTSALAADSAPPAFIEVEARFSETDPKTGMTDLLSAPRVSTRPGNRAQIEITREVRLELPETKIKDATMTVNTGVVLDFTGWLEDGLIILSGTARLPDLDGNVKSSPNGSWAHLRVDEVPFILRVKDGEPWELPIASTARGDRGLTIKITAKKHVPVNASPLYWQAFAVMPKLDEAEKKLLDSKSVGDSERALVARAEPALNLLEEASHADYCEWNLDLSKGPSLPLPHLATARELARLALLKARLSESRVAIAQQQAVLRMARDVGASPLLICRLVDLAIESMAIDSLASMFPEWPEEVRNYAGSMISALPSVPKIADDVAAEGKSMSAWLSNELEAELKKGGVFDARAWIGRLLAPSGAETEKALQQIDQTSSWPKDAAEVRQLIDRYRVLMEESAELVRLPHAEMKEKERAFQEKHKTEAQWNVLIGLLVPSFQKAREREVRAETHLALLKAALEVQAKGDAALADDLATYAKTERGFTLTSKELFDGKPVVLTVGR